MAWTINKQRLLDDLHQLRQIGVVGTGVVRPAFSVEDVAARKWLADRFSAAGLASSIDGVGNVWGDSPKQGPALLLGSHSDTQPTGGWLDGALGVIAALEVVRAASEATGEMPLLDIVSWQDEENRFVSCLGSRSFCGVQDEASETTIRSADGVVLADAISAAGLQGVERRVFAAERHRAYIELHIEQGARLEEAGLTVGVVTGIVGIRTQKITFLGHANHAGTTTMARRHDAAAALFEFGHRINMEFPVLIDGEAVWTIGRVSVWPGAPSIVPGRAECDLQMRSPLETDLDKMEARIAELARDIYGKTGVAISSVPARDPIRPVVMDPEIVNACERAAESCTQGRWTPLFSLAGHDPMVLSQRMKCGMIFIPSIGGISHDFAENSLESDIIAGAETLAEAARLLL